MTIGWIKLHRVLLEKEIFQDAYVLKVFLYVLLKAAYKEMKIRVGNQSIELAAGQLLYGRKSVSEKLGMGEGKLRGIMDYLVQNGSITIESHSKYSIVTIVNWEQYQKGECEPDFPFDVDFLDEEDGEELLESQPTENQMPMQSGMGFPDLDVEFLTSREPQYNNINKYKNNNNIQEQNNKTKENKIKENKTKENQKNTQNIENTQSVFYRQNRNIMNDYIDVSKVAEQGVSQEMLLSDGTVISNGKAVCGDIAEIYDTGDSSEAFTALSMMDDAALDAYFAGSIFADFGNTETDADIDFAWDGQPDPCETDYVEAHKLFNELWNQYPVQVGKEKVTDAQIMRLYEIGKKQMQHAIRQYQGKKHRVPKQYWMNGSTFFNGGYEKYLG